jgi:hypothetical protein
MHCLPVQVQALGSLNSTNRTQYDTDSAGFWADGTGELGIGMLGKC